MPIRSDQSHIDLSDIEHLYLSFFIRLWRLLFYMHCVISALYEIGEIHVQRGNTDGATGLRAFIAVVTYRGAQTFRLRMTGHFRVGAHGTEKVVRFNNVTTVAYPNAEK